MKKFSKFIAVSLASSMMLSTVALAAEDDFYKGTKKEDLKYTLNELVLNKNGSKKDITLNHSKFYREVDNYLYTLDQVKVAYEKADKAGEPLNWKEYLKKEEGIPLEGEEVEDEFGEIESIVGVKKEYNLNDGIEFTLKSKEGKEIVINQENREESLKKLKKEGYTFKYRANEPVFKNPTMDANTTSEDGILFQSDLGDEIKIFNYEIDAYKDGKKVASSARVLEAVLMDYSQRVEEITSVEIIDGQENSLGTKMPEFEAGTLKVMGKVKGVKEETDITKFIKEAKAEKPLVLELVLNPTDIESGVVLKVKGLAKGTTKINLETENKEKGTFSITVGEKAKVQSIELEDGNKIMVPSGQKKTMNIKVKDNYGRDIHPNSPLGLELTSSGATIESKLKENIAEVEIELKADGSSTLTVTAEDLVDGVDKLEDELAKLVVGDYKLDIDLSIIKAKSIVEYELRKDTNTKDTTFDLRYKAANVQADTDKLASKDIVLFGRDENGMEIDWETAATQSHGTGRKNPLALETDPEGKNYIRLDKASEGKAEIILDEEGQVATITLTDKAKAGDKIKVIVSQHNGSLYDDVAEMEFDIVDNSAVLKDATFKELVITNYEEKIKLEDLVKEIITEPAEVELTYKAVNDNDNGLYPVLEVYEELPEGYKKNKLGEIRFNKNEDVNKLIDKAEWEDQVLTLTIKGKDENKGMKGKLEIAFVDSNNKEVKSQDIKVDIPVKDFLKEAKEKFAKEAAPILKDAEDQLAIAEEIKESSGTLTLDLANKIQDLNETEDTDKIQELKDLIEEINTFVNGDDYKEKVEALKKVKESLDEFYKDVETSDSADEVEDIIEMLLGDKEAIEENKLDDSKSEYTKLEEKANKLLK